MNDSDIGLSAEEIEEAGVEDAVDELRAVLRELASPVAGEINDAVSVEHTTPFGDVVFTRYPNNVEAMTDNTQVESFLRYTMGHLDENLSAEIPGWSYVRTTDDGVLLRIDRNVLFTELL